jgi:hypothetical protein
VDTDRTLWRLAKRVRGWGRIQILERLTETTDPDIRAWMLRRGYRNDVMYEYTAHLCATTGDLVGALRQPQPDPELLHGAGELLQTLIDGREGPAQGIDDYPEGAEAAELFLRHAAARPPQLSFLLPVITLRAFLRETMGASRNPELGWVPRREALLGLVGQILGNPGWESLVRAGLDSPVGEEFRVASQAAEEFGLDAWDAYYTRVERGAADWYFLMQTEDPTRIDRALALAEARLDLDRVASGPASELGLGPDYQDHHALDFMLQELPRFPGKGWPLIRAGLRSPVVRNRNMAAKALGAWERSTWPPDAHAVLERALELEPEESTRDWLERAQTGRPVDDDEDD